MIYTVSGKYNVTETEVKAISSKITSVVIGNIEKSENVVIEHNETFTKKEDDAIMALINSKRFDVKVDFAKKTDSEKQDIRDKKLGLK